MFEKIKKKTWDFAKYYPLIFTVIFVVILFQYSFSPLEAIFYDLRVRFDFGNWFRDEVVLITLDEESDEYLGENYPYTYATHEGMLTRLFQDKPKIVNYLISMGEPESVRDEEDLKNMRSSIEGYLADGGFFRFGTEMDAWGEQIPPRDLRSLGYSLALINVDNAAFAKDDVSRRMILNISGEDSLHLWSANRFRESRGDPPLGATEVFGSYYTSKADATFAMYRFGETPVEGKGRIKTINFHKVRVGLFPKGYFTNKIVLVGPSYLSNVADFALTPFNKEEFKSPKLALHSQLMQALIHDKTVYAIPRWVTYALSLIVAIGLSIIISQVRPTKGLLITIMTMMVILLFSYLIFCLFGLWLYVTHLVLTIFVVYYIWVPFRAIGEYQRRYAIQEEAKLLKKVESLKQNFISLMSHDLKTPVAKIAGIADVTLRDAQGNIEVTKGLNNIIDATKELNKFITSILDLTKIESQNLALNKINKDVNSIIKGIVEELRYEANQKSIKVVSELAPLYPIEVDIVLIKRVLSNLIENALKYSGENSTVTVKTWDDDKWVTIEIEDNGVGIPEEDLEHIFDKFYRVKNDASHSIKGTGLGLYLVKYFVELHGGTISASSKLGQGTNFTVKLINK
ncbi:MAG: hypothetical protein COW01_05570 [Bdellovibrionales bacterium CG12_big_fil_rev_8_21_14_0_65_38_15]|nr:MAG: hypothetical protein COW79_03465 [Bdellovibrionales bacterium CG22_combo_CG10-13_8_21_14_all_38_13]PIQ55900.1 MAG: hypothetical protein COW01_05570 [Bdellovibrionales bacterium CG12_big_fil_rev_8_21_14_0_65_38_15]PIR29649.1 MAG: hypothetical protein COV38_09450 [Bdellovibrionales bacterium CG11_big_fil_rev_8_21_14_0_20_38_13]